MMKHTFWRKLQLKIRYGQTAAILDVADSLPFRNHCTVINV